MEFYYILSREVKYNNWILNLEHPKRRVMPEYAHLVCDRCGKVDEVAAIRSGIRADIRIRGSVDFLRSSEGLTLFSERARESLKTKQIAGLEFIAVGTSGYYVALPKRFATVNVAVSTMKFQRKCQKCSRFRETTGFPSRDSMKLPRNPRLIVAPDVFLERYYSRTFVYVVSSLVQDVFATNGLTGAIFDEV